MTIPVPEDGGQGVSPNGICASCGARLRDPAQSAFATVFARLTGSYRVSDYEIERITGVGHEYLSRLRRGLKRSPSKDMVATIVFALARHGLEITEADRLYDAAGYVSPHRRKYRDDPVEDTST